MLSVFWRRHCASHESWRRLGGQGGSSGRCATSHMTQTFEGQSVLTSQGLLLELVSPHCENCIVAFAASSTFTVQKKMKASNLTCWLAGILAVLFVGPAGHTRHLNQSILWEGLLILNYSDIIFFIYSGVPGSCVRGHWCASLSDRNLDLTALGIVALNYWRLWIRGDCDSVKHVEETR